MRIVASLPGLSAMHVQLGNGSNSNPFLSVFTLISLKAFIVVIFAKIIIHIY